MAIAVGVIYAERSDMSQAIVIHRLLVRDPDSIPQGGDGVDRTLFLRRMTEEALRVTRCGVQIHTREDRTQSTGSVLCF